MTEYILGIDGGTECLKSGIFDIEGNLIAISSHDYCTYHNYPGWAEQKVEQWREALIFTVKDVIEKSRINPSKIVGVGYDATSCTVIFIDKENNPVRDSILWMDVRASDEARLIESIEDPARKYNGYGNVSPEWFPCKNLWVKKNQPDIYKKSKIIAEYTDWITHELTGIWTIGISTATIRAYYDNRNGGWQKKFYEKIGLSDLFEKLPEKVLRLGEIVGGISKDFSSETGLIQGTPVGQGAVDATSASIGSNSFSSGQVFFITGSSNFLQINLDKEFHTKGLFGSYPDLVVDNFSVEGGQTSTGSVLKWFKTNFINCSIEEESKKRGISVYKYMDSMAEKIPLGSEGVIVLEHFQGNRTPFTNPNSRGVIRGLSLKHTPAHIYRAIMEACAYGTEATLKIIKENSFEIKEIIVSGGHMNSEIWAHIYADVTGLPIKRIVNPEATVSGSAIIAGVASGRYKSISEAADKMVKYSTDIMPDIQKNRKYKVFMDAYLDTYFALKESIHDINDYIKTI